MASVKDEYQRLRDELWFRAREWFSARDVRMPVDEALIGELATVKYEINSAGKMKVESKDQMKDRGIRSPDLADAFVLTFVNVGRARRRLPIEYPKDHVSNAIV